MMPDLHPNSFVTLRVHSTAPGLFAVGSYPRSAPGEGVGGVVNKWLDSHSYGAMGICAVTTLRMCLYACRISLISGLLNEHLICWVGS